MTIIAVVLARNAHKRVAMDATMLDILARVIAPGLMPHAAAPRRCFSMRCRRHTPPSSRWARLPACAVRVHCQLRCQALPRRDPETRLQFVDAELRRFQRLTPVCGGDGHDDAGLADRHDACAVRYRHLAHVPALSHARAHRLQLLHGLRCACVRAPSSGAQRRSSNSVPLAHTPRTPGAARACRRKCRA